MRPSAAETRWGALSQERATAEARQTGQLSGSAEGGPAIALAIAPAPHDSPLVGGSGNGE